MQRLTPLDKELILVSFLTALYANDSDPLRSYILEKKKEAYVRSKKKKWDRTEWNNNEEKELKK
jgi:hypothetical protein